ncbi:MAG: hypothetical protein KME52_12575 [Desmonostoc geniculatum HA4340-LM1]|jgi:hypothetical protein|nr:hypothetical protein [Desmonostoc geniculatum HA4340-LM1]
MKDIDLIVSSVTAPLYLNSGETIPLSLSWTVTNQGTVSTSGYWYDAVYISDDQFLDSSDRYLTERYTGEDTPLASGSNYTATQDIFLDSYIATGDRYLLFVANGRGYFDKGAMRFCEMTHMRG